MARRVNWFCGSVSPVFFPVVCCLLGCLVDISSFDSTSKLFRGFNDEGSKFAFAQVFLPIIVANVFLNKLNK